MAVSVLLFLFAVLSALPAVKCSHHPFGINPFITVPHSNNGKGLLSNNDKHAAALWVRGGGGGGSYDVTSVTTTVTMASWLLHGLTATLTPIGSMKRGGVSIQPESVGHFSYELTGCILISLSLLLFLTKHSSLPVRKAVVLSYVPLDLYCLSKKNRLNNLGASTPGILAAVAFDWLVLASVWMDLVPVPNWFLCACFGSVAVAGLLFPKQMADCCNLKLKDATDKFAWTLIFLGMAMYSTAVTTLLKGGTTEEAVRFTLVTTLLSNLWGRLDKNFEEAGFSKSINQDVALLYVVVLLALLFWK